MIFISLILIMIFGCFAYAQLRHYRIIKEINHITANTKYIPLIVTGRTVKAFTIEKSKAIIASETIAIDAFSIFIYNILSIFNISRANLHSRYLRYARKFAYNNVLSQAKNADYIVNIREQIHYVDDRHINLFVTCNALYRFEDTLPIFTFNKELIGAYVPLKTAPVMKIFSTSLGATITLILCAKLSASAISSYLVNNTSIETEQAMWSYIQNSVMKDQATRSDLKRAQSTLNSILSEITPQNAEYPFELFVTSDETISLAMLPYGKMLISKGLIETFKTKNEVVFLLSHMMTHYQNHDHLRAMHTRLLNLTILTSISGANGLLGTALVWQSDFKATSFSNDAEIRSDEAALDSLNSMFGNISGYDFFKIRNEEISSGHAPLNHSHPVSTSRYDAVSNYIETHAYQTGEAQALDFKIKDIVETPKFEISSTSGSQNPFTTLFDNYKADIAATQAQYTQFLKQFDGALYIDASVTQSELLERQQALILAANEIAKFKTALNGILNKYNTQFDSVINSIPAEQRGPYKSIWNAEYKNTSNLVAFYTERDKAILENQAILLQFLASRYGAYSFNAYGITFSTDKERSDYIVIQDRINKLIQQTPPSGTND